MKSHVFLATAVLLVVMQAGGIAHADSEGMPWLWRAPGSYFGDPVPISDRDESSQAESSFRITFRAEPVTEVRSRDILVGLYSVVPNAALGYAYAGFAVPFSAPMAFDEGASFQFDARAEPGIERLELVLRDTSRRRATSVVEIAESAEWTTITVPASELAAIDQESIESAAIVVLSPGEGRLEISNVRFPVRGVALEQNIVEEIRTAPKWYTNGHMGVIVAQRLNRPLLVCYDSQFNTEEDAFDSDIWRGVLKQTVNVRVNEKTIHTLPDAFTEVVHRSSAPMVALFEPDGTRIDLASASESVGMLMDAVLTYRARTERQ